MWANRAGGDTALPQTTPMAAPDEETLSLSEMERQFALHAEELREARERNRIRLAEKNATNEQLMRDQIRDMEQRIRDDAQARHELNQRILTLKINSQQEDDYERTLQMKCTEGEVSRLCAASSRGRFALLRPVSFPVARHSI